MPHPTNEMCMRPTHICQTPASQLVAAHESHDNDELPNYDEIINNINDDKSNLIDSPYYQDEKKEFEDKFNDILPSYNDIEREDTKASNEKAKKIANICAVLYGLIFLLAYFAYSSHTGCF